MKKHPRSWDTPALAAAIRRPDMRDPRLFVSSLAADFDVDETLFVDSTQAEALRLLEADLNAPQFCGILDVEVEDETATE